MKFLCLLFILQLFLLNVVNGSVSILQGRQFISVGQDRFLNCEPGDDVDEGDVEEVVWKRDGRKIENSGRFSIDEWELMISSIEASDAGSYQCEITVEDQTHSSQPVSLTLYEKIKFHNCKESVTLEKGQAEGEVKCEGTSVPAARFTWSRAGKTIKKNNEKLQAYGNTLKVKNVELSDSGIYHFVGKQAALGIRESFAINVTVHERVEMVTKGSKVDVKEEGDTQIHCEASGFPAPTYSFLNGTDGTTSLDGLEGFSVEVEATGATLHIKAARPEHTGDITCKAFNKYTENKATFFLNVLEAPRITGFKNVTSRSTEKLEITCKVRANPPVLIEIGRVSPAEDDEQTEEFNVQRSKEPTSSFTFSLDSTTLANEGEYYCLALHDENTDFPDAKADNYVKVLYPPLIEEDKNTKVVKTWLDNPAELVCVVRANPPPTIKWVTQDDDGNEVVKNFDGITEAPGDDDDSAFAGYNSQHEDNYYHSHLRLIPRNKDKIVRDVQCEASNALGTSDEIFQVQEAYVPGAPEVVRIVGITATSFRVVLGDVDNGGTPVTSYQIIHYEEGNKTGTEKVVSFPVSSITSELLSVEKLRQKTTYMVEVRAQNGVGLSEATVTNVTTLDRTVPSKVIINLGSKACHQRDDMLLNWQEPYSSGLPIKQYRVLYKAKPWKPASSTPDKPPTDFSDWVSLLTSDRSLRLKGLEQSTEYQVFVEAQNDVGWSTEKDIQSFDICKDEPVRVIYMGPERLPAYSSSTGERNHSCKHVASSSLLSLAFLIAIFLRLGD